MTIELANQILENYQPETVEDMQNALKDKFGSMFETMLKGEMRHHLGMNQMTKPRIRQETGETDTEKNGKDQLR